ncbi:MAG: hypothetical protein K2K19_08930 [Acetatifactor sp.]|nr:hypothetical protein [Acetatifactor sp.]
MNKKGKKIVDMSQYRYYPEDKRTLELNKLLFNMRDFRLLYIFSIPVWAVWGSIAFGILVVYFMEGATAIIIFILFMIPLGIIILIRYRAKNKDEKNRIIENANTYLSNVGEDFLEQLQADLNKGLPFMKKITW